MKDYKQKVARRVKWWAVSTVVVLAVMLALGYAVVKMIVGIPWESQPMFLYVFGAVGIAMAFFLGQAVNSVLVRSWDNWIADLGPAQIDVMVQEMLKQKTRMEKNGSE